MNAYEKLLLGLAKRIAELEAENAQLRALHEVSQSVCGDLAAQIDCLSRMARNKPVDNSK